ncbi:PolC-type DNA polymerase III [Phascolarctobacterium faecium]|nr:PolC-type DNA polymerase III [Phascolarctobacterium faecium]MDM8108945.1 PolC-type DNA polymerase III [Phascolarctobacterium faecium]
MHTRLIRPQKIFVDVEQSEWVIEYKAAAPVEERLALAVADKLAAAFSLHKVELSCCNAEANVKAETEEIPLPPEPPEETEFVVTNCSGQPIPEEIPLPEEPPQNDLESYHYEENGSFGSEADADFARAYELLYGNGGKGKNGNGVIWGKNFRGEPRPLDDITEEENNVVVEGQFVKCFDKDGVLTSFNERELRTKRVKLSFNLSNDTNGIFINMYFQTLEECHKFKSLIKPGVYLRIMGDARRDRYAFDEMTIEPKGIMLIEKEERMDNAEVKRVELHCHTKMSKMDALTPMEDLVKKAIKWGHKALAITDHGVVQAFPFCYDAAEGSDLKLIFGMEGYLLGDSQLESVDLEPADSLKPVKIKRKKNTLYHIIILAKNEAGLRNLYKLVTFSHLKYYDGGNKRPALPRNLIEECREGLLLGSACVAGELYSAVAANRSDEELLKIASFYDYLEIQPLGNNMFMVRDPKFNCTVEDLKNHNRKIYEIGKKLGKLVVATCDVHFLNPEDSKYRTILHGVQHWKDAEEQAPLYYRTTEEMLAEFEYLGKDIAYEVCVTNPNKVADMVDKIKPVPDRDQLYSPSIPGAVEALPKMVYDKAHEWYGDELPEIVAERIKTELDSIINNGFAILYYIAHKLVRKSLDDGYLVGSRGSVGSSLVATLIDITEVNPLAPHYRCPKCRYSEFFTNNEYASGFDLPEKNCPHCGTPMWRDGHNIPFAVFLGFHGDKVPDIDLNFSGEYQPVAHKYTEELFGRDNVCRAGTISTVASKTAFGYVRKYYEEKGLTKHPAYMAGLVEGIAGLKRTTGQHPGGIMVVPRNMDIHYITPMNHPADERDSTTVTTHFDYHSINDRLVKLDILGHDDPTVIKLLEEFTHIKPTKIPIGDEATMSIFRNTEALGVTPEQINSSVGTYGIPEFGTRFVRQMVEDVQPKNFGQIVRVSGYSHGTDVWLNNAQDLIKEGKPPEDTIATRDDVMTNLIAMGVEPSLAFKTMEYVRKGKAAKNGLEPKMLDAMKAAKVPEWFINSCQTVKYLFPKAHAIAYVLMAYRIAYCKVHYPKAFYAAYFSVRAPEFDAAYIAKGKEYMKKFIKDVYAQGGKANNRDKDTVTYLELAVEMMERGLEFEPIDLYKSHPTRFLPTEKGVRIPLAALSGIGTSAALSIDEARSSGVPFISQEDLRVRSKVSKSVIEKLAEYGTLKDLPENDQIDLF